MLSVITQHFKLRPGHVFRPRFYPSAIRVQKKQRRKLLGLVYPRRCPTCRKFTRQVVVGIPKTYVIKTLFDKILGVTRRRRCLSCGTIWRGGSTVRPRPV